MSERVVIFHNPRCTKSRQTLELLRGKGIEPEIVEYLKDPPSKKRIAEIIDLLGVEAHAILRRKEAPYKALGLSKSSTRKAVIDAIAAHPILLERPVVVKGAKAAIGRPPENVLAIL